MMICRTCAGRQVEHNIRRETVGLGHGHEAHGNGNKKDRSAHSRANGLFAGVVSPFSRIIHRTFLHMEDVHVTRSWRLTYLSTNLMAHRPSLLTSQSMLLFPSSPSSPSSPTLSPRYFISDRSAGEPWIDSAHVPKVFGNFCRVCLSVPTFVFRAKKTKVKCSKASFVRQHLRARL